jgi:serine/threonine protein phosphatase PrpC
MRVIGAGWSDIGLQRHTNEDSFAVMQEGREAERQGVCYVVCDGLGGAPAGEVASRLAADALGVVLQRAVSRRYEAASAACRP